MPYCRLGVNIQTMHPRVLELPERDHGMIPRMHALARVVLQVAPQHEVVPGVDHVGGIVKHFQVFGDEQAEYHVARVVPVEFKHIFLLGMSVRQIWRPDWMS